MEITGCMEQVEQEEHLFLSRKLYKKLVGISCYSCLSCYSFRDHVEKCNNDKKNENKHE